MIVHYLKIAFRNMWKYKSQTLISVTGLAVGFTCFALATLWIRYEMTYDNFHKNAKKMYVVYAPSSFSPTGYSRGTVNPLAAYLKETFPEIVNASPVIPASPGGTVSVDGVAFPASTIMADSSFLQMFNVKILEGSREFLFNNSEKLAITQRKARQLFGNEDPIGKKINGSQEICAIVSELPGHSNYSFDFILSFRRYAVDTDQWNASYGDNIVIELLPGTNTEVFKKKLYEHIAGGDRKNIKNLIIKPLTTMRYTDPDIPREVKFQHILIFAVSGLLVVLCSLFNYLTLFVSRFRIRQKELALRMVCGASGGSLLTMLSVEFLLTTSFAVIFGCGLTQWLHEPFLKLSDINMGLSGIYTESLVYITSVIFVSLLVFWAILYIFRHRSLNLSIRQSNKKLFRKSSIVAQLIISIGFAFCTIIILKQMYFLHNTNELGFSFKNRGSLILWGSSGGDGLENQLKQIPEITEIVNATGMTNLVPQNFRMSQTASLWDDKPADAEPFDYEYMVISPEYNAFYGLQLIAGEMLTGSDPDSLVLLNESAVKAFGWHEPVGKNFNRNFTVKGVIKNVYNFAPTTPAKPVCYRKGSMGRGTTIILFKYRENTWKSCKEKIEQLIKKEYPGTNHILNNAEEVYDRFLKSENALIKLLSIVSAICVLICVFGFVSLVSLACEENRKAIAIRKINGATVGDILAIFAKEYSLLLIIGASIAFPAGYIVMQRWLEQYVKQTNIAVWVYLSIIFVLALAIVVCVGWQVYRSSIENPSEVVKGN